MNSGNRRRRETKNIVQTLLFNGNGRKYLYPEEESGTTFSSNKGHRTHLIPFTTCIRTLPFVNRFSGKHLPLLIFNLLKSIYLGNSLPTHILEHYHHLCTCVLDWIYLIGKSWHAQLNLNSHQMARNCNHQCITKIDIFSYHTLLQYSL